MGLGFTGFGVLVMGLSVWWFWCWCCVVVGCWLVVRFRVGCVCVFDCLDTVLGYGCLGFGVGTLVGWVRWWFCGCFGVSVVWVAVWLGFVLALLVVFWFEC